LIDFESAPQGFANEPPAPHRAPLSISTPEEELPPYLKTLNPRQREAALVTEGPLIVLAGAGSGKTRMVTARIAYLIGYLGVAPWQILAVTFTNKAAGEMKERVEKALALDHSTGYGGPEIGTFHSVCVRMLRREMDRLPFKKSFTIYDDSDQLALIKSVMAKLNLNDKTFSPQSFQSFINKAKCEALEPDQIEISDHSPFQLQARRVYTQYQKDLFESNAVDFGEILCMAYRLLRDHDDVRAKYQRRYRYIHVDEYQDTNRAQYLFLATLAGSEIGGHHNICVVGDEDQSIYKWRGADIRNILDFEKDFGGASVVKLEQNYRSTKTIITAASHLIRHNRQRKEKFLWTDNEEGDPIIHYQVGDDRFEAETVVREIKNLLSHHNYSLNDFAIFYRTHAQSRQLEDLLRRDRLNYKIVGGLRFYERKEIKDILCYLKVLQNSSDGVSLRRIINVPARGIGKTTLDKLDDYTASGKGPSLLWEVLQMAASGGSAATELGLNSRTQKKLAEFVGMIQKLSDQQPHLMLSELYHRVLDQTGYVMELKKEASVEATARVDNLEELDNLIQEFEEETLRGLSATEVDSRKSGLLNEFLERTALVNEVEGEVDATSVKMMTLHSSKGLEFPVVFMVGMEEGLFPSTRSEDPDEDEEVEEERRLCYVGMTRAREKLYFSNAVCRRIWGTIHYQDPARFFKEIPEQYMKYVDLSQAGFARSRPQW